jgi:single-stranded-DNA-specific exonuclease
MLPDMMSLDNVTLFQDRFEEVVSRRISPEMLTQEILIDAKLC